MRIGVFATFMSPIATAKMITDFGRRAEDAGLESLWMGEHVVLFDEMEFGYPGSADGRIPVPANGGLLDTVATFGLLAGCTKNMRFGTGISLVPQRNPLYTAKEFATLDWLTGGRIDFGIGVGWCKEEVIACGYGWEDRGERCDEFLTLMQKLWTEPVVNYQGKHVNAVGVKMDPKPIQKPHIPIIVGGHSPRGLRRAAEFGSGWYGFGMDPTATRQVIEGIDAALASAGRTRDGFEIVITPNTADADTIREFADLGVDRLVLHLGSQKPEKVDRRLGELETLVSAAA
ncbi:MAG: LLM class F420-dependent oxidoreductase [Gammaproteobacteria bacterium]|nr:LLM class F420-dependent oxidoreductase [Gammaproteobacteria bacterium]|tara:strand:+ start:13 stop:876 length:864 start_codon:yes stop_codon:yes gene_type:complete